MSDYSFDVGTDDFSARVLEKSREVLVLVDFWAEWCGPCRVLKPVLERLAAAYAGRFLLAKVDADQHPELSGRFRVRGIPTVKAFRQGEVVDEFTGALPESSVRAFIDQLLPSPAEPLLLAAQRAQADDDLDAAALLLQQAMAADTAFEPARLAMAEVELARGRVDVARATVEPLRHVAKDPVRRDALLARLALAEDADGMDAANLARLEARVGSDGSDLAARFELANALASAGRYRDALEHLLAIVSLDARWNDQAARKRMVDLFALLATDPSAAELVREYRVRLARTLN